MLRRRTSDGRVRRGSDRLGNQPDDHGQSGYHGHQEHHQRSPLDRRRLSQHIIITRSSMFCTTCRLVAFSPMTTTCAAAIAVACQRRKVRVWDDHISISGTTPEAPVASVNSTFGIDHIASCTCGSQVPKTYQEPKIANQAKPTAYSTGAKRRTQQR